MIRQTSSSETHRAANFNDHVLPPTQRVSAPDAVVVLVSLVALFMPAAHAAVVAGPGHMDIDMNIDASGQWTFSLSHDGAGSGFEGGGGNGSFERPADVDTVIYIPGEKFFNRPSPATWNFLGVNAGESVWIFPQVQDEDFVWPGLNTEATALSSISTWLPSHSKLTVAAQYMELRLTGMEYYGEGTNNQFSMWVMEASARRMHGCPRSMGSAVRMPILCCLVVIVT